MENYLGWILLAALVAVAAFLWRKGFLFGPGNLSKHMCGCCNARGFRPERHDEETETPPKEAAG